MNILIDCQDSDIFWRCEKNFTDKTFFLPVIQSQADPFYASDYLKKLGDKKVAFSYLHHSNDLSMRLSAMEVIDDLKIYENIALTDRNGRMRSNALHHIANEDVIIKIAKSDSDKEIRLAAVRKIKCHDVIRAISNDEKDITVRNKMLVHIGDFTEQEVGSRKSIEDNLRRFYKGIEPKRFGFGLSKSLNYDCFLQGFDLFDLGDYWHLFSYGLSELFEKESNNPRISGMGFELSVRLKKTQNEPIYLMTVLENLACYINKVTTLSHGHFIRYGKPGELINESELPNKSGLLFADNNEIGVIDTPNGTVKFLDAFFLDDSEIEYCWKDQEKNTDALIEKYNNQRRIN